MLTIHKVRNGLINGVLRTGNLEIRLIDHPCTLAEGVAPIMLGLEGAMADFVTRMLEPAPGSHIETEAFNDKYRMTPGGQGLSTNRMGRLRKLVGLRSRVVWIGDKAVRVIPDYRWKSDA